MWNCEEKEICWSGWWGLKLARRQRYIRPRIVLPLDNSNSCVNLLFANSLSDDCRSCDRRSPTKLWFMIRSEIVIRENARHKIVNHQWNTSGLCNFWLWQLTCWKCEIVNRKIIWRWPSCELEKLSGWDGNGDGIEKKVCLTELIERWQRGLPEIRWSQNTMMLPLITMMMKLNPFAVYLIQFEEFSMKKEIPQWSPDVFTLDIDDILKTSNQSRRSNVSSLSKFQSLRPPLFPVFDHLIHNKFPRLNLSVKYDIYTLRAGWQPYLKIELLINTSRQISKTLWITKLEIIERKEFVKAFAISTSFVPSVWSFRCFLGEISKIKWNLTRSVVHCTQ